MARLRHLVVVVPGIGGSVLHTPRGAARWSERKRALVAAGTRPHRLGLDETPELVPVDLLPDVTVLGATVLPGYQRLVQRITARFDDVRVDVARPGRTPDLRADLLLFPYDFRQSVQHAAGRLGAEIAARLGGELPGTRRRRVIVVAHSMGGLVARYWLGPGGGAPDCAALITLGTPHRGAPKALDVLVNGVRVGPKRLTGLTGVLRGWPSVYELLPRYPAIGPGDGQSPLYPHQLAHDPGLADPGLADPGFVPPGFAARARAAYDLHRDIETAWDELAGSPQRPLLTAVFSRGHATPQQALRTAAGIEVGKTPAPWLPNPDWHGDGTVPAVSAIPIELDADLNARRPTVERHVPLAATPLVLDLLAEHAGEPLHAVRGDAPDRPWLGLDLDDTAPAGRPVPLGVTLHGADADERTRVSVRLRPAGGSVTPWREAARSTGGASWHTELGPLPAGTYRVEVAATEVPVTGRLTTGDVLGILDTDALEADALEDETLAPGTLEVEA
ncbi:hypothetical protein [Kitasatospora sp. NPDC097643]|uniref:PGAP1-like alpha/beta domain-containing protein n=1 Tax=Kitasatospora sp. NPDC097643 TaxID=3157230 RepID=UPI0033322A5B